MNLSSTIPIFDVVYAEQSSPPRPDADHANRRQDTLLKQIHLVWPEKVGLVTASVIAVLSALVCATVLFAAGTVSFGKLNHVLAVWSGVAELTIALPTWLLMRGIDFAASGPAHRRADRKSRFA